MEKYVEKFSYSKLNVYEQCPFKYKITYVDHNYIDLPSIAADFGTLIHYIEEYMGNEIIKNNTLNYDYIIDLLMNINDDNAQGINILKQKYPVEFYEKDKNNENYEDKLNKYINNGITRLEKYLKDNPQIKLIYTEHPFEININDFIFKGIIDRIFYNEEEDVYIIEDIKTYNHEIKEEDLKVPLQFVLYCAALMKEFNSDVKLQCYYDLPLLGIKQLAGTSSNFVKRGLNKINKTLGKIYTNNFDPKPSPLCHWCIFSGTYKDQPEKAKNKCAYYSLWTKEDNKNYNVAHKWEGLEMHQEIISRMLKSEIKIENNTIILENLNNRIMRRR